MRVKIVKYKDISAIIIYITKQEKENKNIKYKISQFKNKYGENVSIFISGKNNVKETLKEYFENLYNEI